MEHSIGIIGAGAWGTAIAKVLADKGHHVTIWALEEEVASSINGDHVNAPYLPGIRLPDTLRATTDIREAADGKEHVILAVPSLFLVDTIKKFITTPAVMEGKAIISILTKGFLQTPKGYKLITDVLEDHLPGFYRGATVYISGPSHAEEVAKGKMTGLISASANPKNAIMVRDLLSTDKLLVFASLDPIGVQSCAATKNVVAIAFGILDALKANSAVFGDNTESLLLAAGLNEIQTIGRALGATHPETFTSIAGVGDLDVTCRSVLGRNRRFGREIAEKRVHEKFSGIEDLLSRIKELGYLPEGTAACRAIRAIAEEKKLKLPICDGVYRILNRESSPEEVIKDIYGGSSGKVGTPAQAETKYPIKDMKDGALMWPVSAKYRDLFIGMMKKSRGPGKVTEENVFQEGNPEILPFMDRMVEENLKPGSGIQNFENIEDLFGKSQEGKACLLLVEHYSNLDLPAFHYLLRQQGPIGQAFAESMIAIAGYKLNEEDPAVLAPTEAYSRIVIVPSRSLESIKDGDPKAFMQEMLRSTSINRAASRTLADKKKSKRVILVYPAGTRYRPWDPSSKRGVREIDSYVKGFDYMCLVSMNGNILRLNPEGEMLQDLICEDKLLFTASPVLSCAQFRESVRITHFGEDKKQAVADAIMKGLEEMHESAEPERMKE
jgi:glycerol-3-phosphate dehydrogenase (NAD(P)+)